MTRLAIFDCEGTLVDGQAGVCGAMEEAFAAARLPAPERCLIRRTMGLSLSRAVQELAPRATPGQQARIIAAYPMAYRRAGSEKPREPLFDGMEALLGELLDRGTALGIATGRSSRGLAACLATHGLEGHFATVQTADGHPSKPHPAMLEAALAETGVGPEEAVMIGDTVFDIEMAAAAGVRAIGVGWGYHDAAELRAAGAGVVVFEPAALKEAILEG
jgi:phosphoglycolate phosphatase